MVTGRAWRLVEFGEPEKALRLEDLEPDRTRNPGRILIRVRTAGAGYPDAMMAAGHFPLLGAPPFGLGEEAAGEVVAVPRGSRFSAGDQVTGITAFLEGWGGYAEYTYLREHSTILIPAGMTDEQAGGFPIGFRTAYAGLVERTRLETGQTLAVLGAAGSSGGAATQLGRALGARVIAVAGGGPRRSSSACSNGADAGHRLPRRGRRRSAWSELTDGRGVDVIYDPVGGATAAAAVSGLARGGRIVVIGLASGRAGGR